MLPLSLVIGAMVVGHGVGWHWGALVLFGGAGLAVLPIFWHERWERWTPTPWLRRAGLVFLAIAGATALLLWQRLFVVGLRQASLNNFGVVDRDVVFWWSVAGGLVPFRAILLLAPPWSVPQVLVAGAALAVYLQELYGAI